MQGWVGLGQDFWLGPWPYAGRARPSKIWPDPGPFRVRSGQPSGQLGLVLPADSVTIWGRAGWLEGASSGVSSGGAGGARWVGVRDRQHPFSLNCRRLRVQSGLVAGPWLNGRSCRSWHFSKPRRLLQRCSIITEANSCMISVWMLPVEVVVVNLTCSAEK